jgi:hypothetical protein
MDAETRMMSVRNWEAHMARADARFEERMRGYEELARIGRKERPNFGESIA